MATITAPRKEIKTRINGAIAVLPPYPDGWYALGFSDDVPAGSLLARKFMGQEVVIFRSASGVIGAASAYCPHLGAHLGYGGTVEGETVRCTFHGFRYDLQGNCVATSYGTRPPPKAKLTTLQVSEVNGIILAYHDGLGRAPRWDIPSLKQMGWMPIIHSVFQLYDHPQETTENSVDLGHFAVVHKYKSVEILSDLVTDGLYLTIKYAATRPLPGLGDLGATIRFEYEIHIYGFGYSLVNVHVPALGLRSRLFVLAAPIDEERINLYLGLSQKQISNRDGIHPILRVIPKPVLNWIVARFTFWGLVHDATQDFEIWQRNRYLQPPALADGDGPIGRYRIWARQFYSVE